MNEDENKVKHFYVLVNYYDKKSNEVYLYKGAGTTVEEAVLSAVPQSVLIDKYKFLAQFARTMTTAAVVCIDLLKPQHMKGMLQAMFLIERNILINWMEVSKEAYRLLPNNLEN